MKYNKIYDNEFDGQMCYKIIIEEGEDYEELSYVINKGDVIEMEELNNKVFVNNIEYTNNKSIKIFGYETNYYPENFEDFENKEIKEYEIYGKRDFYLYRYRYFNYEDNFIEDQVYSYNERKEKKKYVSEVNIQNKCFEILKNYISKKGNIIVYGFKSFEYLKNDSLKVLMISYDILNKIDEKYINKIKNENHKYKETNIVIYDEESIYYDELLMYGGIIGVMFEK